MSEDCRVSQLNLQILFVVMIPDLQTEPFLIQALLLGSNAKQLIISIHVWPVCHFWGEDRESGLVSHSKCSSMKSHLKNICVKQFTKL